MNAPIARTPADGPQLRTILLTDLVDSTALVERLGDVPASELFREHDRLVLLLQQQWRGRLIDRSDGLLLLFERPIDGLGFALDYARGLRDIGQARKLDLQARAGLHVGEVLTWKNSDAAVLVGAKPLEVEGLAKPMAARLMTLARPGQILLSAMAEPLARRAARELGERGQNLLWKPYGRWRFKGVPEPQEVYEVGEVGIAPLRAPSNTPKAWRDIPLWRRPAALAAEVVLIAGLGVGAWFVTKPQPAIAFAERDWVVVGDLRNLTGQSVLDDTLEQAFRISLEQSRYVNVLSDMKARDTLARMQRPPDTLLDRDTASEIALRDGVRAVILPTVSEIGGRVRFSVEVVDPHTQTTVYAQSADGKGAPSTLDSIDQVTAGLRGKLGEAMASIEKDSMPLPQVTTRNLDALRAYALAQKAYARGDHREALQLYERATQIDSKFALAWLGQMRSKYSAMDAPAAVKPLRQAQALRSHLAPREALYLDAWAAEFDKPTVALAKWQELAALYPDFWPAQGNVALGLYAQNRFSEAIPFAKRNSAPQNELSTLGYDWLGRAQLGLEQYSSAAYSFNQSLKRGYSSSLRRRIATEAAQRNFVEANKLFGREVNKDRYMSLERTSLAIDQAKWVEARSISSSALDSVKNEKGFDGRLFELPAAVSDWLCGDKKSALRKARTAAEEALSALAQNYNADAADDAALALSAALVAQRLDDKEVGKKVLAALGSKTELMLLPSLAELAAIVQAEQIRLSGKPDEAIKILQPFLTGNERYQTRVALQEAYAISGNYSAALEQARWLQRRRGLAYIELGCGHCLQALNVADSNIATLREAELLALSGKSVEASKALQRFDRLWPVEALPNYLRVRRSLVRLASS
jgi:putative peptide modification system cyclase